MFQLSCHCGKVTLSVNADTPTEAISCNCSICRRKGPLYAFYSPEEVTVDQGEADLVTYQFNRHVIDHRFCATCGCQTHAQGVKRDGTPMRAVNLRCAPDIDLDALTLKKVDGASF